MVFIFDSELVGDSEDGEQDADGQPPGTSFVDGSRWGGGAIADAFARRNGASVLVVRFSTCFGTSSRPPWKVAHVWMIWSEVLHLMQSASPESASFLVAPIDAMPS